MSKCKLFHRWRLDPLWPNQKAVSQTVMLECKRCGKKKSNLYVGWLDTDRALEYYRWLDTKDQIGRGL